jgi:hypothetical protein
LRKGEILTPKDFDDIYLSMVELYTSTVLQNEPRTYREASISNEAPEWTQAMKEELESLEACKTWEVVDRPTDKPVVSCKWVYKKKLNSAGEVACYKTRLVAHGFSQIYGVDYKEMFTPVTRLETIRLMFSLAVEKDWEIRQVDVKNTYLYGDLNEEIYMEVPTGYGVPDGKCLHLLKALYSLKQAGRAWYRQLKSVMTKFGLTQVPCKPHLFIVQKVVKQK